MGIVHAALLLLKGSNRLKCTRTGVSWILLVGWYGKVGGDHKIIHFKLCHSGPFIRKYAGESTKSVRTVVRATAE